jgi:hypothetical protein
MTCALCNEQIEDIEVELGEVRTLNGEHWHAECFIEYFGDVFEDEGEVLEEV